ncbi:MAG: STAS domain-containing protein [Tepidisphaeraceae bacterium]
MTDHLFRVVEEGAVGVVELTLPIELDEQVFDRLNDALLETLVGRANGRWVLDLAHTLYAGSAALGLMVNLRQHVKQGGGRLVLCGLSPQLVDIFHACCMESLFTITRGRVEAIRTASR